MTPRTFSVAVALPNGAFFATTLRTTVVQRLKPLRIAFGAPSASSRFNALLMASTAAPSSSAVMLKDARRDIVRESLVPVAGEPRRERRVPCGRSFHGDARDLARRRT